MNSKRIYPDLGTWRDDLGLTQEQAAAKLGLSQGYYSRLEQRTRFAGKKLGKIISKRARVPLESVLGIS